MARETLEGSINRRSLSKFNKNAKLGIRKVSILLELTFTGLYENELYYLIFID